MVPYTGLGIKAGLWVETGPQGRGTNDEWMIRLAVVLGRVVSVGPLGLADKRSRCSNAPVRY